MTEDISPALTRLLEAPERLTPLRLWRALPPEERSAVTLAAVRGDEEGHRVAVRAIAKQRNFRPQTVRRWPNEKIAEALKPPGVAGERTAFLLLTASADHRKPEVRTKFSDLIGPIEEGESAPDSVVHQAATALVTEFGAGHALIYLFTRALADGQLRNTLGKWLRELASLRESAPTKASEDPVEEATEPDSHSGSSDDSEPDRQEQFTTLDRLLILAAVDARQEVLGAEPQDAIDDAVDELIQLNGRRHRSYFHAGFRDALFDRPLGAHLPAENTSRLRWYWNGAIQGLARTKAWGRIVSEFDDTPAVRELGDGKDAASRQVTGHVVEALEDQGRAAELSSFVQRRAVTPKLYDRLTAISKRLLRDGAAAEQARLLLKVLEEARPRLMRSTGAERNADPFLETDRCMALALQQLGEFNLASNRLQETLKRADGSPFAAALHTDLGLVEGRFASLIEVRLPHHFPEVDSFARRLEAGQECFREALARGDHGPAHYCLGVLALTRADHEVANGRLERAHARIRRLPAEQDASLLVRLDLYVGVARLLSATTDERLAEGTRLIVRALDQGARVPTYLVKQLAETLQISLGGEAALRALLGQADDATLNHFADSSDETVLKVLADRLLQRAAGHNRSDHEAASDYRLALDCHLRTGQREAAEDVLDKLEEFSLEGVGSDEFLDLLKGTTLRSFPWSQEERALAAARCRASHGDYENAASELRPLFHQYANKTDGGHHDSLHDAAGVIETIKAYGLEGDRYGDLERRYEALCARKLGDAPASGTERQTSVAVKVLVVGGNEIQAKDADRVKSSVQGQDPGIELDFLHSGWTSNWNKYLGVFKRRAKERQAVVLMRFMRTQLGRSVRKECGRRDIPWRFCWSGGQGGLIQTVLRAADAGRQHRPAR